MKTNVLNGALIHNNGQRTFKLCKCGKDQYGGMGITFVSKKFFDESFLPILSEILWKMRKKCIFQLSNYITFKQSQYWKTVIPFTPKYSKKYLCQISYDTQDACLKRQYFAEIRYRENKNLKMTRFSQTNPTSHLKPMRAKLYLQRRSQKYCNQIYNG